MSSILRIKTTAFEDDRGWFAEIYNKRKLEIAGLADDFVQDNHSLSYQAGTLRGLHFQLPPKAQAKLVRCVRGSIFDVAVDIRQSSPTYGKWVGATLSAQNRDQLYVPMGFAHGFVTLEPDTEVVYKVTDSYSLEHDCGCRWDDPDIAIDWPLPEAQQPNLSRKDAAQPGLADFVSPFPYDGFPLDGIKDI
jgi:dTDP-4-dehydrorhamnose 3,5-epimerase